MKNFLIIAGFVMMGLLVISCSDVRRNPGRTYVPDMAYSRAIETYSSKEELEKKGIHYNALPVEGTIAQGDMFPYALKNTPEDYIKSAAEKRPLTVGQVDMIEAERLYLIYCGICHGSKLDGNGPLFNGGDGPFTAAPKNFMDADMKAMTEGTMFHSATYGKGQMGSYASQLNTKQRWMVISYIKEKQVATGIATKPSTDSITVVK